MPRVLLRVMLSLLYPPRCPFCRTLLLGGEPSLCGRCRRVLPWTEGVFRGAGFRQGIYVLQFRGAVRSALLRYKFGSCSGYARVFGEILAQTIAERLSGTFDLVSYVPVSRRTLRKRGYDQERLLAEAVAEVYGVRAVTTLRKIRRNRPQSSLTKLSARQENVRGVYAAVSPERFAGKRVLLIDDIVTTGATLYSAALTLRSAGAADVVCAALAGGGKMSSI